ncbi:MAG: hypothetical protein ACYS8I_06825 [Planctomycetota bacterium]
MTSTPNHNEQVDDISEGKKDVLRALDIMPPYGKASEETTKAPDAAERKEDTETRREEEEVQRSGTVEGKREIPRFDLAEQILAEQRKISAIKRKAPGKRIDALRSAVEVGPAHYAIRPPAPRQPYQQQIISEIVARDIERLCRGDYSVNSSW